MRSKLFLSILMIFLGVTAFTQDLSEKTLAGKWIPEAIKLPSGVVGINTEALTAVYGKDKAAGIMQMKREVYLFSKNTYELGVTTPDKGKYVIIMGGKKMLFTSDKTKIVTEAKVWLENGMLVMETLLEDGATQTIYYKKSQG